MEPDELARTIDSFKSRVNESEVSLQKKRFLKSFADAAATLAGLPETDTAGYDELVADPSIPPLFKELASEINAAAVENSKSADFPQKYNALAWLRNNRRNIGLGAFIFLFIPPLASLFITLILCFLPWDRMGQFGDSFGVLNAMFSGLAFAAVAYTLFLQRKELSLQRRELRDTREELRRSADSQEELASLSANSVRLSGLASLWARYRDASDRLERGKKYEAFGKMNWCADEMHILLNQLYQSRDARQLEDDMNRIITNFKRETDSGGSSQIKDSIKGAVKDIGYLHMSASTSSGFAENIKHILEDLDQLWLKLLGDEKGSVVTAKIDRTHISIFVDHYHANGVKEYKPLWTR